jgi:hypothetical protein
VPGNALRLFSADPFTHRFSGHADPVSARFMGSKASNAFPATRLPPSKRRIFRQEPIGFPQFLPRGDPTKAGSEETDGGAYEKSDQYAQPEHGTPLLS